jgi:hypothetical protein
LATVAIMPPAAIDVIAGDPASVAAAGRTLTSIADEVARHAARLRSMSSSGSGWSGKAATAAHSRSVTLPPKLDKVTASYGGAGRSLLSYAGALADAQQRSAGAVAALNRADAELQSARAAQANAAELDRQAAQAAASTGQLPPAPTAPRYQVTIDEAGSRIARATAVNAQAHADRDRAAARAAAGLKAASHDGIRNQSWWQHFTHSVAHWTTTHWRSSLAELSALAGKISMLASIAAVVLAIGGIFFPPLEAAAAAVQAVAIVTGMVANVTAAAVELSDKRSRKAGGVALGMMFMPRAASKLFRRMPLMAHAGLFKAVEDTPPRSIPLGFKNQHEFEHFGGTLRTGLGDAGYSDTVPIMQGSSVSGFSFKTGEPFDVGRVSDYDVALAGRDLAATAERNGIRVKGRPPRSRPLGDFELRRLGLRSLCDDLSDLAGRPVAFMVFRTQEGAVGRGPSVVMTPR